MATIKVTCPYCKSDKVVCNGKTKKGLQRYICKNEMCSHYNEPINQDKKLKKISDLDIMKIRKKKKRRSKLWESEQHIQQSTRAK